MKLKLEEILKCKPEKEVYHFNRLLEEDEELYIEFFNLAKNDNHFDIRKYLKEKKIDDVYSVGSKTYSSNNLNSIKVLKSILVYQIYYKGWRYRFEYKGVNYIAYVTQEGYVNSIEMFGMLMADYSNTRRVYGNNLKEIYDYSISLIKKEKNWYVKQLKEEVEEDIKRLNQIEKHYDDILKEAK